LTSFIPEPLVFGSGIFILVGGRFRISISWSIPGDYEDMLREWHLLDPPNQWEEERNTLIAEKQGNRNPFIDRPELVERVGDF